MNNKLKAIFIALIFTTGISQEANCQYFTKNSIKLGFGLGNSSGYYTEGLGFFYTLGYQREIYKDRLRFNPNFSIGHYSSKFYSDIRDQYFISLNLETNLYYDLFKIKSFSVLIGTGAFINNSRGLLGTGGMDDDGISPLRSEFINKTQFGGCLMGGFRINPANKQVAIEIMPLNIHFGKNDFMEFHVKIGIDIKFHKMAELKIE